MLDWQDPGQTCQVVLPERQGPELESPTLKDTRSWIASTLESCLQFTGVAANW